MSELFEAINFVVGSGDGGGQWARWRKGHERNTLREREKEGKSFDPKLSRGKEYASESAHVCGRNVCLRNSKTKGFTVTRSVILYLSVSLHSPDYLTLLSLWRKGVTPGNRTRVSTIFPPRRLLCNGNRRRVWKPNSSQPTSYACMCEIFFFFCNITSSVPIFS